MKPGFHLKLTIAILTVFGLLILGYVLYEPVWWRWQAWKLGSDDTAVRDAAVTAVAGKREKAIQHTRVWLKSSNDSHVADACAVLLGMEGNGWKELLPELTDILRESHSKRTNAAAAVVFGKKYACRIRRKVELVWMNFKDDKQIKKNILHYLVVYGRGPYRWQAAFALGSMGDACAVEPLVRNLLTDEDFSIRRAAVVALGFIGDSRAVGPLIYALENDSEDVVRWQAADALGEIGDIRAIQPLIKVLKNDSDLDVRDWSAIALANFDGKDVEDELRTAYRDNNTCALIAFAFRYGGEYLDCCSTLTLNGYWQEEFFYFAQVKWGNKDVIEEILRGLPNRYITFRRFHTDFFSLMPDGFPQYDLKASYTTRKKQAEVLKVWYKKHKHRLAWDQSKRKYYLRPEGTGK